MYVRKTTKLRIAYGALTATALAVSAYDAHLRSSPPPAKLQAGRITSQSPALPLGITRLAESPFPEARPDRMAANPTASAHSNSTPGETSAKVPAASTVYFLTVPIQVDSGDGPVSFSRGTKVRLLRQQDGKFLVRHNRTDFLIEKSQATDDVSALAALTRNSS